MADEPQLGRAVVFFTFLLVAIGIPAWLGALTVRQVRGFQVDLDAALAEMERWFSQPTDILGFQVLLKDIVGDIPAMIGDLLVTLPDGSLDYPVYRDHESVMEQCRRHDVVLFVEGRPQNQAVAG